MRITLFCILISLSVWVGAQPKFSQLRFITEEYPPYNYSENSQLEGIAIDLLERAFAFEGELLKREAIESLPWARGYETVLNTPNTVLFSTTRTEARETLFEWVGPISSDRVVLMARRDNNIEIDSIEQLNESDLNVAVILEDIGAQRLQELGVNPDSIHTAINNASALAMLNANRVDLWAYGEDVAFWLMDTRGYNRQDFEPVYTLSEANLYFALNKDTDPELVERFHKAVESAKAELPRVRLLTEEYPPFNYLNEQQEVSGSATEILRWVVERAGLETEFQLLPWARALTEAQLRENTCVYSTTRTAERETLFNWIGPLVNNQWGAFSLSDSGIDIKSLDDNKLSELRLGSFREDAVGQYVQALGYELILATTDRENLDRLQAGLIDVWITSVPVARFFAEQAQVDINKLFVFNEVSLYLACHNDLSPNIKQLMQTLVEQANELGIGQLERLQGEVIEGF